jgi:uncharacterized UBP type Zn finger protein
VEGQESASTQAVAEKAVAATLTPDKIDFKCDKCCETKDTV